MSWKKEEERPVSLPCSRICPAASSRHQRRKLNLLHLGKTHELLFLFREVAYRNLEGDHHLLKNVSNKEKISKNRILKTNSSNCFRKNDLGITWRLLQWKEYLFSLFSPADHICPSSPAGLFLGVSSGIYSLFVTKKSNYYKVQSGVQIETIS